MISIPNELSAFHKVFTRHEYKYDAADTLDTFCEYLISGFCADGTLVFDPKRYQKEDFKIFPDLFTEYVKVMERMVRDDSWYDLFGTYFEAYVGSKSRRSSRGQFFTPPHVCDLMVKLNGDDNRGKGLRVGDPTCGSGRLLLAFHCNNGYGNYLAAEDIDRTCCMMTVCNFLFHGVVGEVVWHDSLQPESWNYGWKVNQNLNNPLHKHFGIPHVETLNKEDSLVFQHWQKRKEEVEKAKEQPKEKPKEPDEPQQLSLNFF